MREIKFRVWDGLRMRPVLSFDEYTIVISDDGPYGDRVRVDEIPAASGFIMQFTGLKDKNGLKEIYEGDIIDGNGNVKGNIYESPQIYQEGINCIIESMGTEAWRSSESIAMGRGCKYSE